MVVSFDCEDPNRLENFMGRTLQEQNDFNFLIAYANEEGRLTSYSCLGELKYGNKKAAEALLKYVKTQIPKHKWDVVRVGN